MKKQHKFIIKILSLVLLFFIFREVLRLLLWITFTQVLFGNLFEFIHSNSFYYSNIPYTYHIYNSLKFPLNLFTFKILLFCLLVLALFVLSKKIIQYIGNWIDKGDTKISNIFLSRRKQNIVHNLIVSILFFCLVTIILSLFRFHFDKQIHHIMNPGLGIGIDFGNFTPILIVLELVFLCFLMIFLFKSIQKFLLYLWGLIETKLL